MDWVLIYQRTPVNLTISHLAKLLQSVQITSYTQISDAENSNQMLMKILKVS